MTAAPLRRVEEVLDAHVMADRLREALGAARAPCHVLDAKYQPGVGCTVLYAVGDRLVRGDLLENEGEGKGVTPHAVPGHLVAPGMLLTCFPDDPALPALRRATDPQVLTRALSDAVPAGRRRLLGCRVGLLRYRAGRRATLSVVPRPRTAAAAGASGYVVKAYHDGRKAAAVSAEAALLSEAARGATTLRLAPVLAHLHELSAVVQGRVDGVPLDDVLAGPAAAAEDGLRRTAQALAELHRLPPVSARRRPVGAELTRFASRSERVAGVAPAAGAALGRLAARLAETAGAVRFAEDALVHGDCKPSQFLLGREHVLALDLDSCGRADPAVDVGTFIATLRQQETRRLLAASPAVVRSASALAGIFLDAYCRAVGAPDAGELARRVGWFEAVALERKALRAFARAPRSPMTTLLVEQGHRCLDRLGGTP